MIFTIYRGQLVILIPSESKMSVFFSHHPCNNPGPNDLLFFDKHQGRVVIELPSKSTSLSLREEIKSKFSI